MLHRWVVGSLTVCALMATTCICSTDAAADESQHASRHRKLQQITYITSFDNLPGFEPVQEELTPENPPPQVIYVPANQQRVVYVPAPVAPPPPSLADYIVGPTPPSPSLQAPAPAPAPGEPPSPANIPNPSPPTPLPPSPFAPAPAESPAPMMTSSPTPTSSPFLGAVPASPAASTAAPVSAAGLFDLKGAVLGRPCQSVWQILNQDPDLKAWVAVLQGKGLSGTFNSSTNKITMFAPVDAAFSQKIFPGSNETNGAQNVQQLLSNRPDAVNPIIGYNILPAMYNVADLTAGKSLDTTDTAKSGNSVQGAPETLQVNVTSNTGSAAQLKGIGSTVNILQGDIPACGPSVIHITDNALLPLEFAQGSAAGPVTQQG